MTHRTTLPPPLPLLLLACFLLAAPFTSAPQAHAPALLRSKRAPLSPLFTCPAAHVVVNRGLLGPTQGRASRPFVSSLLAALQAGPSVTPFLLNVKTGARCLGAASRSSQCGHVCSLRLSECCRPFHCASLGGSAATSRAASSAAACCAQRYSGQAAGGLAAAHASHSAWLASTAAK